MGEIRIKRDSPDWDNRPAHQVTNGQFVDIPTHHYTNGRWQGELTSQAPLEFKATGQSLLDWRVDGRTSGNLFDGTLIPTTTMGITFRLDDDGYMYASPTNSDTRGWTYTYSQIKVTLPLGNYTLCLSGTPSTNATSGIRVNDDANTNLGNKGAINGQSMVIINFAVTDNHNIGIVAKINDGRFRVQILKGTYTSETIPPYEPYGGVGDWDETAQKYKIPIRVEGENLFDIEHFVDTAYCHNVVLTQLDNGIRIQATSSSDPYVNYTYWVIGQTLPGIMRNAVIPCNPNTDYTLCCAQSNIVGKYISYFDKDYEVVKGHTQFSTELLNFKTPENCAYILLRIGDSSTLSEGMTIELTNIQILEGTYTSSTIPPYEVNLYTDHQLMDGDSIDYTTDQTAIPIATGNNVLTVDTAVQPSKVFVKFEG